MSSRHIFGPIGTCRLLSAVTPVLRRHESHSAASASSMPLLLRREAVRLALERPGKPSDLREGGHLSLNVMGIRARGATHR
jgi:hypothetical protein